MKDKLLFTISDAADQVGVVPATIRNWERRGLFTAKRSPSGYRVYSLEDIEVLKNIRYYSKDENEVMNLVRDPYFFKSPKSTGEEQHLKGQVSKQIIGEKWRDYRLERGYLLEEVAKEVGISPSYLSRIENGLINNVSYSILQKLASFYGENILFYFDKGYENKTSVVRQGESEKFSIGIEGLTLESLATKNLHTLSPMIFTAEPGSGRHDLSSHRGEEFIYVLSGILQVTIDNHEHILKSGDSIQFSSESTHAWYNPGSSVLQMLWIHTPLILTRE